MSAHTKNDHGQPGHGAAGHKPGHGAGAADGHGHGGSPGGSHAGSLDMGHHHVSSASMFMNVLLVLLFLTIVTVVISRFDFGGANMLIAMGIASVKASLVILFFMHMKWDTAINKIVFLSSFLFLSLLFIFTLGDQATRRWDSPLHTTRTPVDMHWVHPGAAGAKDAGKH